MKYLIFAFVFVFSSICNLHAADFINFEERHNAYMSSYQEYRDLDEELNASWKTLRSKCSKEQFKIELEEQRNWLKNREHLIEKDKSNKRNEKNATLKVIKDRIAYINYKIFEYDNKYIDFSIQKTTNIDPEFFETITKDDDCYAIVPSRSVFMVNHFSIVKRKSNTKWINEYVYSLIEDNLRNQIRKGNIILDEMHLDFYPNEKGTFDYDTRLPDITGKFSITTYNVEYENDNFACISVWYRGNIGLMMPVVGPSKSIFVDKKNKKVINFDSLFEYPRIAKTLVKNIILLKLKAFETKKGDEISETTYDEINEWDFDYAYINKNSILLIPDTIGNFDVNERYLFKVSLDELAVASPKKEYFTD